MEPYFVVALQPHNCNSYKLYPSYVRKAELDIATQNFRDYSFLSSAIYWEVFDNNDYIFTFFLYYLALMICLM